MILLCIMDKEQYFTIPKNRKCCPKNRSLGRHWAFQHENDPKRRARIVTNTEMIGKIKVLAPTAQFEEKVKEISHTNLEELEANFKEELSKICVYICMCV